MSQSDGDAIIQLVQVLQPTFISVLNTLITKKAAFVALPHGIPATVKADLDTLNTENLVSNKIYPNPIELVILRQALEAALIALVPVRAAGTQVELCFTHRPPNSPTFKVTPPSLRPPSMRHSKQQSLRIHRFFVRGLVILR